jgi:hypothetical protein
MKMTPAKMLAAIGLVGLGLITALVLIFSPLTSQLLEPGDNSDWLEDVLGLILFVLTLFSISLLGITSIIACCQLGKRLGYDLYAGLLLLIPGVNVLIFFYWAFKESPNERRLRTNLGKKGATRQ